MRGDDAISLWRYVNNSDVRFQFSYGPLGLVEPISGQVANVAEQLRSKLNLFSSLFSAHWWRLSKVAITSRKFILASQFDKV